MQATALVGTVPFKKKCGEPNSGLSGLANGATARVRVPYRGEDRGAAPMRVGGVWREEVVRTAEYVGMGVQLPTRVLCLLLKKKSILHLN